MNTQSRAWRITKRVLAIGFLALVTGLLVHQLSELNWKEVLGVMKGYAPATLALAMALTAVSHVLYGMFDQIGRAYTGHGLAPLRVAQVAFVCYAVNLNVGALIGGVGFPYRLYSRLGLDTPTTTRILGVSLSSNWLGYMLVAGVVFSMRVINLPPRWEIGTTGLQWIGFALLAIVFAYLAACAFSSRRSWTIRDSEVALPSFRMALLQVGLGALNWLLIAALIDLLLPEPATFTVVLAVMLVSAVAGVIAHVPAGLGVIELVFITLLGHLLPSSQIVGALLAYRAVYYLVPLMLALPLYLRLEVGCRSGQPDQAPG